MIYKNSIHQSLHIYTKSPQRCVKLAWMTVNWKTSGPDGISSMDLKLSEDESIRSLQKVIKKSVNCSKFPKFCKIAGKVSWIHKRRNQEQLQTYFNYRRISLLSTSSTSSKVFERYLCSAICDRIELVF